MCRRASARADMSDQPTFTMHCGLPGSHRSARAREQVPPDGVLVSFRQEARRLPAGNRTDIAAAMNDRIIALLLEGRDVVLDDTNLVATRRRRLVHRIQAEAPAHCRAVFHCAAYENCRSELDRR